MKNYLHNALPALVAAAVITTVALARTQPVSAKPPSARADIRGFAERKPIGAVGFTRVSSTTIWLAAIENTRESGVIYVALRPGTCAAPAGRMHVFGTIDLGADGTGNAFGTLHPYRRVEELTGDYSVWLLGRRAARACGVVRAGG